MAVQTTYFIVADKVDNETVFYKVPESLKSVYEIYKKRRVEEGNYSFGEFRSFAHRWFDRFPEGLEILHTVAPVIVLRDWGFRLPQYEICISKN